MKTGGKFGSQLQLVNCMRENESPENMRKIQQLTMLGYVVFLIFITIRAGFVYFLKMLQILKKTTESVLICLRFPLELRYLPS